MKMRFGLWVLLGGMIGMSALSAQAATREDIMTAAQYDKQVDKRLQSLIPKAEYDRRAQLLATQVGGKDILDAQEAAALAASPCFPSMDNLISDYVGNPKVRPALDLVLIGLKDLPPGYDAKDPAKILPNPWRSATSADLLGKIVNTFSKWCVALPRINGDQDNGLYYIQNFAWFYYANQAGHDFVQGVDPVNPSEKLETGLKFTKDFTIESGAFMDSVASTGTIQEWVNDPRIEISDYQKVPYKNWNDFFTRELVTDKVKKIIPSRPATMPLDQYPERDYIVVSPTDCIMNPLVQVLQDGGQTKREFMSNPLQENSVLDVKGIPLTLSTLLSGVPDDLRKQFVGGTGQSCVLMPNTYHHFHAPVNGKVLHAAINSGPTFGELDFANWVPLDGVVGRPGSDFSQFQNFQRGVIIIQVTYKGTKGEPLTGYVASIPVGLATIGSVILNKDVKPGLQVKRGYTELGNFRYGGSLDILLYSKGLASPAVQTRMGNQINVFDIGTTPAP